MRWPWFRKHSRERGVTTPQVQSGRTMAKDALYMLPKDLEESGRLDLQHYMLRYVLKGNYLAPVEHPGSILDVGCGTGRWGSEMAQKFPQANVIGMDLIAPAISSVAVMQGQLTPPDNYLFVEGDVTKGIPFPDNSFDFVHMRLVVLALPYQQWGPVVEELARVTRPNGWIELVDTTVTARVPGAQQWTEWALQLAKFRGIDMSAGNQIGSFLRKAQLRNVSDMEVNIPLGSWGGRIGNLMMADGIAGARAMETPILMTKLATKPEFDAAIMAMEHDFRTVNGATQPFFIAYGQKLV